MMWTGRSDEAGALGSLLDRTYADAAAAAERPRLLDRKFLVGQFRLWEAELLPTVAVACAPLWTRRAAARTVWRRLGYLATAESRQWMTDHLEGLGLDPGALLGPARPERRPFRYSDGRLHPVGERLTPESADLLRADYDLQGGAVVGGGMEAHGADPVRMAAHLRLTAGRRRYAEEQDAPLPVLHFSTSTATALVVPHSEAGAARLTERPALAVTPDHASIDGAGIRLAGPRLTCYPGDDRWHESAAARAAEVGTPDPEPDELDLGPPLDGAVYVLGMLQLLIMSRLRMMRFPGRLRRWELAAAGSLCGGAGAELLRIGPAALRERAAARRLRAMAATGDDLARALLRQVGGQVSFEVPDLPGTAGPPAPVRITVGTAGRLLGDIDFTGARLRLVHITPEKTVAHLDVRRGGRETIVVIELTEPLGCAPLTVTPDGLTLTGRPALEATADDIALTIPLPGGDWTARAAAGSWYVD
jgi:hypothetical protein